MDDKNERILDLLYQDGKLTTSKISKKTGMPITTVHNRIKKLEKDIIKNYTINIDYEKLGKPICAFIQITIDYGNKEDKINQEEIAKAIQKMHEVRHTFIVTGDMDLLIRVRTKTINELNDFIINKLRSIKGVDKTRTIMVLSSY